jgi:uncharacterized RDD family membrane protein YckC
MALPPKTKNVELNFQPLTEGLGFHPFSDGLPYAPMSKTQTSKATPSSGSGAVVAGPASFVPPTRPSAVTAGANAAAAARSQAPRISVPVARSTAPQPQSLLQKSQPQQKTSTTPKPAVQQRLEVSGLAAQLEPSFGIGYLIKRLFAYLLDTSFNLALCSGALSLALWKQDLSPELLLNPGIVLIAILFLAVFNWAITTAQEVAFGTSIGKRIFGLALNGGTSAVFLRAFFFLPSICFGGLGLIWALFDRRKRCWHDMVVDLQPIEIAKL